jgi:hypothetical protein
MHFNFLCFLRPARAGGSVAPERRKTSPARPLGQQGRFGQSKRKRPFFGPFSDAFLL